LDRRERTKRNNPSTRHKKDGVILKVTMDYEKAYAQVERTLNVPQNYKK